MLSIFLGSITCFVLFPSSTIVNDWSRNVILPLSVTIMMTGVLLKVESSLYCVKSHTVLKSSIPLSDWENL